MSSANKVNCDNDFFGIKISKSKCPCNTLLPRVCEPIWYIENPFGTSTPELQSREKYTCSRVTRNSQRRKYHTKCPMLNQLEVCRECGPEDFKYHLSSNVPTWYLCKEILSGHMFPCGHFKKDRTFNCTCTFCVYHKCCQQPLSNVCWNVLGYGNTDDMMDCMQRDK